jgi:hypothetical protein
MDDESWLTAKEAKDLGLADEVSDPAKLAARARWKSQFKNLPLPVTEREPEPDPAPDPAPEPAPAQAEIPEMAGDFLAKSASIEDVKARLALAPEIKNRCTAAKLPNRWKGYLRSGMTLDEIKIELMQLRQHAAGPEIDSRLGPDAGPDPRADARSRLNPNEIYALRRKQAAR